MIVDSLENWGLYQGLGEKFKMAFSYLLQPDLQNLEPGKYSIEGDDVFVIINEFETKDKHECEVEAHRKHIDIQYIIKGTEMFGYAPLSGQVADKDYDDENDVALYKTDVCYLKLEAGMFIVFYPTDLHQPEVKEYEPVIVKKAVIKIKI